MATRVLADRYELVEPLGSGAMATVWRGRDRRLDREVAIKTLSEQLALDPSFRERFEREAIHVAALTHPNIVAVYDAGSEDGLYYIVMELVDGESLQDKLKVAAPMDLDRIQELAAELLSGLGHAHQKGIVHRDIKPANILITHDGTAKLADFGIAKAAADSRNLTTSGTFMGTPAYASPEQLGEQAATASTDLYSLSCVLYECLVGHPPFEAEMPVGVIAQHLQAAPRSLRRERPDIPPEVEATVLRALEKEPGRRFNSAEEMSRSLRTPTVTGASPDSPLSTIHTGRLPTGLPESAPAPEPPAEETRVKVVVVDDHPFFRDGVIRGLTDSGQVAVVGEAENGRDALELIRNEQPAVALVDYQMPEMDGLDLVHAIVGEELPTRVLLLSAMADSAVVFKAIEEGAAGYLSKDARRKEIVNAVLEAADGRTVLPPELAGSLAGEIRNRAKSQAAGLSDRELQILREFTRGHSIPQAAQELALEVGTVEAEAQTLFDKLGVSDRAAAVAEGMRRGLLE